MSARAWDRRRARKWFASAIRSAARTGVMEVGRAPIGRLTGGQFQRAARSFGLEVHFHAEPRD